MGYYDSARLGGRIHFGKLPAKLEGALKLEDFYAVKDTGDTPWGHDTEVTEWNMLGNGPDNTVYPGFQGAGNCTIAGADHEIELWTKEGGNPAQFTGENAIEDYIANTNPPYNPQTGDNDTGCYISDVVNYETKTGMIDGKAIRHKILAGLSIETTNLTAFNSAGTDFDAVGIGVNIYQEDMDAFDAGRPWDTSYSVSSLLGGHYIPGVKFDGTNYKFVTWGVEQIASPGWVQARWDEAWAKLSQEMLDNGKSIDGLDLAQLQAALAALNGGSTPVLSRLILSGAVPTLTVGVPFDLSTLTLTGADQNGNPVSLEGLTPVWQADEVTTGQGTVSGSILTPTAAGGLVVAAVIGNIASNTLGANVVEADTSKQIIFQVGNITMMAFGKQITLDLAPMDIDIGPGGRTVLPARADAEARGDDVQWDEATKTVTITPAVTPATLATIQAELTQTQAELAQSQTELATALNDLANEETVRTSVEQSLAEAEAKLATLEKNLADLVANFHS